MNERERLKEHKRIVIKVGTSNITYPNGKLNLKRISKLAWTIADLRNQGKEIVLVSSGAIAIGADRLGLSERPRDIIGKQVASAVGQAVLMQIYENFFMEYNQKVAQILLTKDVIEFESRKQNAKNTISTLFKMNVVPIVNENDTVSTDELTEFSENDNLSAHVACLVESDCLIILSDKNGLYTSDPRENEDAALIPIVYDIDEKIIGLAGGAGSRLGTGGMATKVAAAKLAADAGIDTVIASGESPGILFNILDGEEVGTLFTKKM